MAENQSNGLRGVSRELWREIPAMHPPLLLRGGDSMVRIRCSSKSHQVPFRFSKLLRSRRSNRRLSRSECYWVERLAADLNDTDYPIEARSLSPTLIRWTHP